MLSGIGPADDLEAVGIDPVVDLPVGQNLIDHLLIGVVYDSKQPIPFLTRTSPSVRLRALLALPRGCDIEISFTKEMHFAPPVDDGVPRYTIIPGMTQPRSRGTLRLCPATAAHAWRSTPGTSASPTTWRR